MKARLKFNNKPYFNYPPDKLVCPGKLVGRGEGRQLWTMIFTVSKQISTLVYEGDLTWLAAPSEQDFGKGVRFQLIAEPRRKGQPLDSRRRDNVTQEQRSKFPARSLPDPDAPVAEEPKEPKEDKKKGPIGGGKRGAHAAGGPPADPGGGSPPDDPGGDHGGGPPPHPGPPDDRPQPNPKIPHPTPDLYTADPRVSGVFAEGVLLGP
jgi:hypothetical protein